MTVISARAALRGNLHLSNHHDLSHGPTDASLCTPFDVRWIASVPLTSNNTARPHGIPSHKTATSL